MVQLEVSKDLEKDKISIRLSEGIWQVTLYQLVEQGIIKDYLPDEKGLFALVINYGTELYYREWVLYMSSPKYEKLAFSFYKEGERIFCKIKSDCSAELNKEIVMNPLSDDLKFMSDMASKL